MVCFIDNVFVEGNAEEFNSINPATQKIIWTARAADAQQVTYAVAVARRAFQNWSKLCLEERLVYLEKYNKLLEAKQEKLALLISEEMGKNINDAQLEMKIMVSKYKTALQAYQERTGKKEIEISGSLSLTKHKPLGVCAVFGPYNFPGHIANGHIVPALIAGNTVVFKPSNYVPKFSEEWMKIFLEAGMPSGVVNMLQGQAQTGEYLSNNADINALFFTGSSRVGEILHKNMAGKLDKVLALELGGNNALVIDSNVDIDKACELALNSAFLSNGQRCTCARRIIIIDSAGFADNFLESFIAKTKALEIAEPKAGKFLSCLISKEQVELVLKKQDEYKSKGAKLLLEGEKHSLGPAFMTPAIIEIEDYDNDEEVFGPFVKIYKVKDLDGAIKLANKTRYGLVSAIVTNNKDHFQKFYDESKTGLINWNAPSTGAMGVAPFGGTGLSGNHRASGYYAADYCAYPVASLISEF